MPITDIQKKHADSYIEMNSLYTNERMNSIVTLLLL